MKLLELAEAAGAEKAIRLKVGAAFHSELMEPTQQKMAEAMEDVSWSDPQTPLVGNATAELKTSGDEVREALVAQIASPVLWVDCVKTLVGNGCDTLPRAGLGPHPVGPRAPDRLRGGDVLGRLAEEARQVPGAQQRLMPKLKVISGPGSGQTIEVEGEVVIGREGADLNIPDPEVSRRHAVVRPTADGVEVEDLGSSNGTLVDGRQIEGPVKLTQGGKIGVADSEIEVELEAAEAAAPAAAAPAAPAAAEAPGGGRNRMPFLLGGLVALAALAVVLALVLGGGDDSDDEAAAKKRAFEARAVSHVITEPALVMRAAGEMTGEPVGNDRRPDRAPDPAAANAGW